MVLNVELGISETSFNGAVDSKGQPVLTRGHV